MNDFLIKSSNIFTFNGKTSGGLLISNNKIRQLVSDKEINDFQLKIIDAEHCYVLPGFIDIHIHGAGGYSASTNSVLEIEKLSKYLASRGITSFQPTIGGGTIGDIISDLKTIRKAMENNLSGAKILGIHMEGPFLNPEKRGAFQIEQLVEPSISIMEKFLKESGNNIIHVTLAPELCGSKELIKYLSINNIVASGGHTNASIEDTKKGIEWGIRLSNHTCNAQRGLHHREPGSLGGYLLDERVDCELICDFFHVHPEMIKLILKIKTADKVCIISDAMMGAGLTAGEYTLMGQKVIINEEGECRYSDGTIAGSSSDVLSSFKKLVEELKIPIKDVIKMISYNPARISNCSNRKGMIKEGYDADLVILDKNFNVQYTFVEGIQQI